MDFNPKTRDLLEDSIQVRLNDLSSHPSKDDEKEVNDVAKLYQLKIEEEKIEEDSDKETARYLAEEDYKSKELEQQKEELENSKKVQKIGFIFAGITLASDLFVKILGYGYEYNQAGMITSQTFRKVLDKAPDLSKFFNFSKKKK